MAIESPQTYGEWFWANSLEAVNAKSASYEKTLAPFITDAMASIAGVEGIPAWLINLMSAMQAPSKPDWDTSVVRFISETAAGLGQRILGHEIKEFDYHMAHYLRNMRITDAVANQLMLRRKITEDFWKERNLDAGYSEAEMLFNYEAVKSYPTIPDIITYARYHGEPESPKDVAWKLYDISPDDWPLWDWLSQQKPTTDHVLSLYKRRFWTEVECNTELARLGWNVTDRKAILDLAYTLPNAMLLVQGALMQEADNKSIIDGISKADIHPAYANLYLDGILTKPAATDIIAYQLRQDPLLSNLDRELRKIGVHTSYHQLYKELAYQIPPVADIITMAVREAFTPEIASRYGQYEGLPSEYVTWVGKKGLSKEWAERYWASHWSLPSPQQGFEMLHRGIITREDLSMLLRALDIMPFWRDKLIETAYMPLTRVDVRRMYQLGVLSESQVKESYKVLGYDETNADRMTQFTILQIRQTLSRFTSNDVIRAFTKRFINDGQARNLLREIGIKSSEIDHIIETAGYKREWADKQEHIDAIENLYKKGKRTEAQAHNELSVLGLPADYITTLLQQWQLKAEAEKTATWTTAQTLSFLKKHLISPERARKEFVLLGYDAEHINIYLASTTT